MEQSHLNRMKLYLNGVTEQRQEGKIRHPLVSILFTAVVATIANAGSWEEVAEFAKSREEWLRQYVEFPYGTPSHDTFERVFRWVDGAEFEKCFILWVREICGDGEMGTVAIDGKTMRGSGDSGSGKKALHVVSAWSSANNLVLGQVKTDEKSNEITAIPKLLDLLKLNGSTVTIDAMGTQRGIAEKIRGKRADYVLSVKKNQPAMYDDIAYFVENESGNGFRDVAHDYTRTVEKGHGRIETREYYLFTDVSWAEWADKWEGLKSFGMAKRKVTDSRGGNAREETAYYISSLKGNAHEFAKAVRSHWGIESVHWCLDVVLNEDRRQVRKDNGAQNLAVLKRMALNILRNDKTFKATGPKKRYRCCLDLEYLETVLAQC